jgi:predicted ribonuclease YlaK
MGGLPKLAILGGSAGVGKTSFALAANRQRIVHVFPTAHRAVLVAWDRQRFAQS